GASCTTPKAGCRARARAAPRRDSSCRRPKAPRARRGSPRRAAPGWERECHSRALFKVLHLLAHLLDQHLEFERRLRQFGIPRLRAERIRFAMELLHQKVETLARAAAG